MNHQNSIKRQFKGSTNYLLAVHNSSRQHFKFIQQNLKKKLKMKFNMRMVVLICLLIAVSYCSVQAQGDGNADAGKNETAVDNSGTTVKPESSSAMYMSLSSVLGATCALILLNRK